MNLTDYPRKIANLERHILKLSQNIRKAQADLDLLNASIENRVANDETLKNDAQRKAKRLELMADELYQNCLRELHYQQDNRSACEIELNLLRNQFSIAKLELKERIAKLEETA